MTRIDLAVDAQVAGRLVCLKRKLQAYALLRHLRSLGQLYTLAIKQIGADGHVIFSPIT